MPIPSSAPLSPAAAAVLAPAIPDSPRGSPRQMAQHWREERLLEGTLSPRRPPVPPSPRRVGSPLSPRLLSSRQSDGSFRLDAPPSALGSAAASVDGSEPPSPRKEQELALAERLSAVHAQAGKYANDAFVKGRQLQEARVAREAALAQVDALRDAHEGIATTCAKLEQRLREEDGRGRKAGRALAKQREASEKAAERESAAHQLVATLQDSLAHTKRQLSEKEQLLQQAVERGDRLAADLGRAREGEGDVNTRLQDEQRAVAAARSEAAAYSERAASQRQQHEQARVALMQEGELRRGVEAEKLSVEVALRKLGEQHEQLQLAMKKEEARAQQQQQRAETAEKQRAEARAAAETNGVKAAQLREERDGLRKARAVVQKRLDALHAALVTARSSLLSVGASTDPVRLHNEGVLARLSAAISRSGATPDSARDAADAAAADAVAAAHAPPASAAAAAASAAAAAAAAPMSPSQMAASAQEQRTSVQQLLDQLGARADAAELRERKLRERLQGIRSRLQNKGTEAKVRAELCTELAEIASFEP